MDDNEVAVRLTVALIEKQGLPLTRELKDSATGVVDCYHAILQALREKPRRARSDSQLPRQQPPTSLTSTLADDD